MGEFIKQLVLEVYVYCTDFIINVANLTNTSYYEVNAFLFCFVWVIITVILLIIYVVQWIRFNRLKRLSKTIF
jgi:flagellar biogenesis protein FliO